MCYTIVTVRKQKKGNLNMRLIKNTAALLGAMLILTGCGNGINYDLPDDPIKFETQRYVSPKDNDDGYQIIEYGGRLYIPYGTISRSLKVEDVGECLGYIVQDGVEDKNARIYKLAETGDYIVEIYINGEMDQPVFYRAEDTIGKDLHDPDYIESLDYDIWR